MQGSGPGWIEISKSESSPHSHIAVCVSNFEAAVEALKARGVELEEPILKSTSKAIYLKQPDPAGNRIHLIWRR